MIEIKAHTWEGHHMTTSQKLVAAMLHLMTGSYWEPRLDKDGEPYAWIVQPVPTSEQQP